MNAIDLLKADHKTIDDLFIAAQRRVNGGESPGARLELVLEIRDMLLQHLDLEERFFYAECARHAELRELVERSLDEHQMIKDLLTEMTDERAVVELDGMFDQLVELIERHIDDEETELFRAATDTIDDARFAEMGRQLWQAREAAKTAA